MLTTLAETNFANASMKTKATRGLSFRQFVFTLCSRTNGDNVMTLIEKVAALLMFAALILLALIEN